MMDQERPNGRLVHTTGARVRTELYVFLGLLLVVSLGLAACGILGPRMEPATFQHNAEQRAIWQRSGISSYHTVVEVERFNERRRADVVVRNGKLASATMQYWSDTAQDWEAPIPLTDEQGRPYTVPGLFSTVGGQLSAQQRSVGVHYDEDYAFPDVIDLGPVHDEAGRTVPNTDVEVRLITFEPLQ